MDLIKFTDKKEVINDDGFALVEGVIEGWQLDPELKTITHKTTALLVKGFGLPSDFVITPPPEEKEGAVLTYVNGEWVYNTEIVEKTRVKLFEAERAKVVEALNNKILKLERLKLIQDLTDLELLTLKELIKKLFAVEELDPADPKSVLPTV